MELDATRCDAFFDTTAEDPQINLNELRSTFSTLEGQFEGRNPAMTTQKSKTEVENISESMNRLQAILQLLQLVDTLIPGNEHKNRSEKLNRGTGDVRKSFDFVDSITNLMVRNDEVVAAVTCGGAYPTHGIISVDSSSKILSNKEAQVRPQYPYIFNIPQIYPVFTNGQ